MDEQKNINADVSFERKDANARALAWIGAGIVVTAILLELFLYLFYQGIKNAAAPSPQLPALSVVREQQNAPTEPQLQVNPVADMKQFREQENEKLNNYGWVNREQGVVRIPIEQAMKLIVEKGLPGAKTNAETRTK
ncbi:MAG: hypothetical protein ACR2N3_12695 [Pyrinomonadaceae bacterium]